MHHDMCTSDMIHSDLMGSIRFAAVAQRLSSLCTRSLMLPDGLPAPIHAAPDPIDRVLALVAEHYDVIPGAPPRPRATGRLLSVAAQHNLALPLHDTMFLVVL